MPTAADDAPDELRADPADAAAPRPRGARRRFFVVAIAIAVALAVGVPVYLRSLDHVTTDDAFVAAHTVPVSALVGGRVAVVHVEENADVKAGDVLVELETEDIEAGLAVVRAELDEALAAVDASDKEVEVLEQTSQAAVDGAKADVAVATAALGTAHRRAATASSHRDELAASAAAADAVVTQSESEAGAARAQHTRDGADLVRARTMHDAGTITQKVLDHAIAAEAVSGADDAAAVARVAVKRALAEQAHAAQATAAAELEEAHSVEEEAAARLESAKARLAAASAAPTQVGLTRSRAAAAAARVERARAALHRAELDLAHAVVRAPADGRIGSKNVEPGQHIDPGQPLLALVEPHVWVVANLKETQLDRVHPGQPVTIEADAFPEHVWTGRVESVRPGTGAVFSLLPPENATGNYVKVVQRVPVRIALDTPAGDRFPQLIPGLSVVPDIDVSDDAGGARTDPK